MVQVLIRNFSYMLVNYSYWQGYLLSQKILASTTISIFKADNL
jgi:hypothetical protein